MYIVKVLITNPVAKEDRELNFQIDPDTFGEVDWTSGYPLFAEKVAELKANEASNPNYPVVWSSGDTKFATAVGIATASPATP